MVLVARSGLSPHLVEISRFWPLAPSKFGLTDRGKLISGSYIAGCCQLVFSHFLSFTREQMGVGAVAPTPICSHHIIWLCNGYLGAKILVATWKLATEACARYSHGKLELADIYIRCLRENQTSKCMVDTPANIGYLGAKKTGCCVKTSNQSTR
jgi:hypothetical protein